MTAADGGGTSDGRRRWPWLLGGGVLVGGLVAMIVLVLSRDEVRFPGDGSLLPDGGLPAPTEEHAFEAFSGDEACADCHREIYERWSASTHGQAGGPPGPETVIAPFDGEPVAFRDGSMTPLVDPAGRYLFVVEWKDLPPDTLEVVGVVGKGLMVGGGTQGFFTRHDDGTERFIPFDWSRTEDRWFCNTRRPNPGEWLPLTPELSLAQCADWPVSRVMGPLDRWANCQQCHGSQVMASWSPEEKRYRTRYTSLRVNCESCHGPGREHVELATSGELSERDDIGMRALGLLDEDASLAVCLRCHATKRELRSGDLPGEPLAESYSLLLPVLTDRTFHPDGRVRQFGYQLNHVAADCYLNGTMTCVSCHDPHGQGYRDDDFRPLEGRFDDGQCTSCHASKAEDVEAHTHHPEGSEGSACVSCHMPYLQQPWVGEEIRYARSDHTIPVPRPASDETHGLPNACGLCHGEKGVAELQDTVEAWYGELKPRKDPVEGMLAYQAELRRGPPPRERAADLLLHPGAGFPLAQYDALARYGTRYLTPDMVRLDLATSEALLSMGQARDPDLRALAQALHHLARGENPGVRQILREALAEEDGASFARRWALSLAYLGETYRARGRPEDAARAYEKALEVAPDDAALLQGHGESLLAAGRDREAVVRLRASVASDPDRVLAWRSLGDALEARGDSADALRAYREATERNPWEPAGWFSLGNAYLKRGDYASALPAFQRTVELDGSIASARVGLAQILLRAGNRAAAERQLRMALEFDPDNPQARQLRERLP